LLVYISSIHEEICCIAIYDNSGHVVSNNRLLVIAKDIKQRRFQLVSVCSKYSDLFYSIISYNIIVN